MASPAAASRFPLAIKLVLLFTLAYMAVATPWAWGTGNQEFLIYIVIMTVIASLLAVLHFRVGLSPGALWGLSIWGLLHMAGGLVPVPAGWPLGGPVAVLYSLWLIPPGTVWFFALKYDQVVHAYGFGIATWVLWQCLQPMLMAQRSPAEDRPRPAPSLGPLVLCVLGAAGLGALNEVIEFITTLVADTNVGGYENTGWDLVSNLVGAVVAAALIWSMHAHAKATLTAPR